MRKSGERVPTASQTVGPFFSIGLCPHTPNNLVPVSHPIGAIVTIRGRVLDGDGNGVPDAILEIWRADSTGKYATAEGVRDSMGVPDGFARIPTNERGEFEIQTLKPGAVSRSTAEANANASHLAVLIFMRGLLKHLITRMYFPDEPANGRDPILSCVPADRRGTLIATRAKPGESDLQWDIHLQGDGETVFFDV